MKKYATLILSYLLTVTLCITTYTIYDSFKGPIVFVMILGTLVNVAIFYGLCSLTDKHHFIGGGFLAAGFISAVMLFAVCSRIATQGNHIYFLEWLLTKGYEIEDNTYFLLALFLFFSTFFSITVFYFTNILYRMFFVTLLSLIPCVVYLKVMAEMDNTPLVVIAVLNMALFITYRKKNFKTIQDRFFLNTIVSSGVFVFLLLLLSSVIPKNTETPFYDQFEDAVLGGDTSSPIGDNFAQLTGYSNDAGGFLGLGSSNRKLYNLFYSSSNKRIPYLKRQNFDFYDFKKDKWYSDSRYQDTKILPEDYEDRNRNLNLPSLLDTLKAADELQPGFLDKYGLGSLRRYALSKADINTLHINSLNFGAIFYLNASQSLSVSVDRAEPYFATAHGSFRSESTAHPNDFHYSINLYDDDTFIRSWIANNAANISVEDSYQCLTEMNRIFLENKDYTHFNIASNFLTQITEASEYRDACSENNSQISEKIHSLALELTDGMTYDYEKAQALADYFYQDFVYDLGYRPFDNSPEYFLFESKRGSCSDYASAYTLMARSVGLTVRYAEGYVPEKGEGSHGYVIKSRDSHAYPEVFLPNIGWVVYEPTVGREEAFATHFSFLNFITDLKMDYGLITVIILFAVLGAALLTVIRVLLPLLYEAFFRMKLLYLPIDRSTLAAYNRIAKKASLRVVPKALSKTPYELADTLSVLGCDMLPLSLQAEQLLYNSNAVPNRTKKEVLRIYHTTSVKLFQNRKTTLK